MDITFHWRWWGNQESSTCYLTWCQYFIVAFVTFVFFDSCCFFSSAFLGPCALIAPKKNATFLTGVKGYKNRSYAKRTSISAKSNIVHWKEDSYHKWPYHKRLYYYRRHSRLSVVVLRQFCIRIALLQYYTFPRLSRSQSIMLHFLWPCYLTDDKYTSSCSCWEWFLSRTGSEIWEMERYKKIK